MKSISWPTLLHKNGDSYDRQLRIAGEGGREKEREGETQRRRWRGGKGSQKRREKGRGNPEEEAEGRKGKPEEERKGKGKPRGGGRGGGGGEKRAGKNHTFSVSSRIFILSILHCNKSFYTHKIKPHMATIKTPHGWTPPHQGLW